MLAWLDFYLFMVICFLSQIIFNNFRDCFPAGIFGKIPAMDDDVTDKVSCFYVCALILLLS